MGEVSAVEQYSRMLEHETRGGRDVRKAMRRLETVYGIPYWSAWNALNKKTRPPSRTFVDRVGEAYLKWLKRAVRGDLERIRIELTKMGEPDAGLKDLETEAEALLARIDEKMEMRRTRQAGRGTAGREVKR